MKITKYDFIFSIRYSLSIILLMMVVNKLVDPIQYDNFTEFIAFLLNLDLNTSASDLLPLFYAITITEILIAFGVYAPKIFNASIYVAIILTSLSMTASVFSALKGFDSSCSLGLFGENPYLLFFQNLVLLIMIAFTASCKEKYF